MSATIRVSGPTWCLCAHQRIQHPSGRRCNVAGCGCLTMRPGPIPARFRDLDTTLGYRRGGTWKENQ